MPGVNVGGSFTVVTKRVRVWLGVLSAVWTGVTYWSVSLTRTA